MPHASAEGEAGLDGAGADRAIMNVTTMRVVVGLAEAQKLIFQNASGAAGNPAALAKNRCVERLANTHP